MNKETEYFITDNLQQIATLLAFTNEKIVFRKDMPNHKRLFVISGNSLKHKNIIKKVFSLREPILVSPAEVFDFYAQLVREIKC